MAPITRVPWKIEGLGKWKMPKHCVGWRHVISEKSMCQIFISYYIRSIVFLDNCALSDLGISHRVMLRSHSHELSPVASTYRP